MKKILFLIILTATGYLAAIYEYPAVLVLFVAELLLLVLLFLTAVLFRLSITAEPTEGETMVFRESQGGCIVRVHNRLPLPVNRFRLRAEEGEWNQPVEEENDFFSACARGDLYMKVPVETEHCGIRCLQLKSLRTYDYLGLFSFSRKLKKKVRVYVIPRQQEIRLPLDALTLWDRQENITQSLLEQGDDEFLQLREYREGDSLKKIDWKSSARLNDYLVRDYAPEKETVLEVLLDTSEYHVATLEMLDHFYELVFGVIRGLMETVPTLQVIWFDNRVRHTQTAAIREPEELFLLFIQLFETDLTIPPDQRWQFRSRKRNPGELYRDWITVDITGTVSLNGERVALPDADSTF